MAAADYSKKTNSELQELLKARSLPHTGRKAELVSRLQEDDKAKEEAAGAAKIASAANDNNNASAEDVIDWDDEAEAEAEAVPTTASSTTVQATEDFAPRTSKNKNEPSATKTGGDAGENGDVAQPATVAGQDLEEDPSQTHDLKVVSKGGPPVATAAEVDNQTKEKLAVNYSIGLAASDVDEEMRKLRARAERFGIADDTKTLLAEKERALQRAKRFGIADAAAAGSSAPAAVKGLDQALPEDRPRKRNRGGDEQAERGGKRQNFNRRGRRGRPNMRIPKGGSGNSGGTTQGSFSEKDTSANEARKKRFATSTL